MMTSTGTMVAAWQDGERAFAAVRVAEADGNVEYIGQTALLDAQGQVKSTGILQSELAADVAARRVKRNAVPTPLAISGPMTV